MVLDPQGYVEVVVVGHGPSLKGAGLGEKIDSKDKVIRLKNCSELLKDPKDYGTKTNIMVSSSAVVRFLKNVKAEEYWACPKRDTWNEDLINNHLRNVVKGEVVVPNQIMSVWNDVFRHMGASHPNVSTGMAAIIVALERLSPSKLWLAGFDNVLKPSIEGYISTVPSNWNDGGTKDTGHDWAAENRLLHFLAHSFNIEIERLI